MLLILNVEVLAGKFTGGFIIRELNVQNDISFYMWKLIEVMGTTGDQEATMTSYRADAYLFGAFLEKDVEIGIYQDLKTKKYTISVARPLSDKVMAFYDLNKI